MAEAMGADNIERKHLRFAGRPAHIITFQSKAITKAVARTCPVFGLVWSGLVAFDINSNCW